MANFRRLALLFLPGACVAGVIAVYGWIGGAVPAELGDDPARAYYNLLVEGFRAGQLSLHMEAPPGLAQLADPYDPAASADFRGTLFGRDRLHDLTYFRGRLFLYFGVTPAVLLFWPAVALTGHFLSHQDAVIVFTALGFLASAGLIHAMWRRYFSSAPAGIVALAILAAGLATSAPLVLQRPEVWEVAVSCGYALTMLTLLALWRAQHAERKGRWLALASLFFGLAVGARPNLLFGAVILLAPLLAVALSFRGRPERTPTLARLLAAALGPLALVGIALAAYNFLRFGNAFDFGQHYQLAADRQDQIRHFAWENLGVNFRLYFLGTAGWSGTFPFFTPIGEPLLPSGHGALDFPYGVLTNTPFLLLALAAPLAWRSQPENSGATLRWFVGIVAVVFAVSALTMGLFYGACVRYELEFSPALTLLAVCGLFGAEASLRGRIPWRRIVLGGATVALAYSIAFTSLYGLIRRASIEGAYGKAMLAENRNAEALAALNKAVRLRPDGAEPHFLFGVALTRTGSGDVGREQVVQAVRLDRENGAAYLGIFADEVMQAVGPEQALPLLQRLARDTPDSVVVYDRIGHALVNQGRADEAIGSFETAVRLDPKLADAHLRLGLLLVRSGQFERAIEHLQETVRLDPGQIEAHVALSRIFSAMGRDAEAQVHREAALGIQSRAEPAGGTKPAGR